MARAIMIIKSRRRLKNRLLRSIEGPLMPGDMKVQLTWEQKGDLAWWVQLGNQLNLKAVISLPVIARLAVILTMAEGLLGVSHPQKEVCVTCQNS